MPITIHQDLHMQFYPGSVIIVKKPLELLSPNHIIDSIANVWLAGGYSGGGINEPAAAANQRLNQPWINSNP